jgi:uncharacterized membrane protein
MESVVIDNNAEDPAAKKVAYIIYILYLCSLVMPILPIVAVIFAYIFENDAKNILKSHYQYFIRSFWIGMLYFSIAGILVMIAIGILLIPLCVIWWIVRMAKGLKSLLRDEAIVNPKTWIF